MDFFSNEQVIQLGGKLFSTRDASLWMPARGSSTYHLPAPKANAERYVGIVRGPVKSPEHALAVFAAVDTKAQRVARRRGLVSHELFIKLNAPGEPAQPELLGLDVWSDFAGMTEHYADHSHMAGLSEAFASQPQASVWEQASGHWSEW